MRKIILLVFSLIFAFVLSYLVYNFLSEVSSEEAIVDIEYIEVLVANNDINEAELITNKDIKFISIAKDLNIDKYYGDKALVVGKYAAEKIYTGEYIHSSRIIDDYSDKLSRDIDFDKRAVAIYTDKYSAVADLLKPGDRVDLYVFIPEKTSGDEVIHPDISKLLIQNIEVLSIDQDRVGSSIPREETPDRYAITLEAYYKDIEKIVLAESIGYLKIALRPMGDDTIYLTNGSVWQELLDNSSFDGGGNFDAKASDMKDSDPKDKFIESDGENIDEKTSSLIGHIYIVKKGDTLMNIAREFYGDSVKYILIMNANNLSDPSHIVTGRKLIIPKLED